MRIHKCDFCEKVIKDKSVDAGFGYLATVELCEKCGEPILKFLRKHKVIDKNNNQIKKS